MATKTVLSIELGDGDQPLISGTPRSSLQRVANIIDAIISGAKTTTSTVKAVSSAVAASATATCAAVAVNDTMTIGGIVVTAKQLCSTGTLTPVSVANNDTCVINGITLTAKTSAPTGVAQFLAGVSDVADGAALAAIINAHPYLGLSTSSTPITATASASTGVVTVRYGAVGTGGDSITLVGTAVRLAASAATLGSGAARGTNQFDCKGSDTETATDAVTCINASATAGLAGVVVASSALGVVTITAALPGKIGNGITLVSSNGSRLAVTGSGRLASGAGTAITYSF